MHPIHRPLVSAAQLTALIAVADCGSVSRAARDLHLAQSTVSGLIASLEAHLGASLLIRGPRGTRLTPLGERICTHARHAVGALDAIQQEVRAPSGPLRGTVQVTACRSAARHVVLPSLTLLRRQHPGIEVTLSDTAGEHDEVQAAVEAGTADVGIGRLPMHGLTSGHLLADEFLVVRPAETPAPTSWAELLAVPLLLADQDCAPFIQAHAARCGVRLPVTRALRDPQVILAMVRAGAGLTILSGLVLHPLPPDLAVSPLPVPLWRDLGWAVHPQRLTSPLITAYLDLLSDAASLRQVTMPVQHLVRHEKPRACLQTTL